MSILQEAEKKFKEIKIDTKQITAANMGLPEPREKISKIQTYAKMQTSLKDKDSDDEGLVESKRKPTIEVHETPRMEISKEKEFDMSLKNLKLEYVHKL
jgi:hypothetical protein